MKKRIIESNELNLLVLIAVGILIGFLFSGLINITGKATYDVGYSAAITNVSSCGTLNTQGETYTLNQSINSTGTCIIIGNDDIVLDCLGYNITGDGDGTDYGVSVTNQNNITIKNCNIDNFDKGIYFKDSDNHSLVYNVLDNNTNQGIYLDNSSFNNITNNTAKNSLFNYGIQFLDNCNNNTIANNNINNNGGSAISLGDSHNNTVLSNVLNNNDRGFNLIFSSSSNIFTDNNISNTSLDISIYNTPNNEFYNNLVTEGSDDYAYPTKFSFTYNGNIEIRSVNASPADDDSLIGISKYLDITNLSAAWIFLNISYNDSDINPIFNESTLRMYGHNGSDWENITGSNVNTTTNIVYGNLTQFSVVAPLVENNLPDTTQLIFNSSNGNNRTDNNLSCYAEGIDLESVNLTAYWEVYNNNVLNLSGNKSLVNNTLINITTVNSSDTTAGENWTCSVKMNDGFGNETDWNNESILIASYCGNNIKETGETCDGTDLNGQDCTAVGSFTGGTLVCAGDCLSFDTSSCTSPAPSTGGGGSRRPTPKPVPAPVIEPIIEPEPIISTQFIEIKKDICAGLEGGISGLILNTGTVPLYNVVVSADVPDNGINVKPLISRKVYAWDDLDNGWKLTGNIPYSTKLSWKSKNMIIRKLLPGESIQWNIPLDVPLFGESEQITISIRNNGDIIDTKQILYKFNTPEASIFTERKGNILNTFVVISNKGDSEAVLNLEVSLNKRNKEYKRTKGLIGLFNSIFKSSRTKQTYLGTDYIVNSGETIVLGQQFELIEGFYYDEAKLTVTDSDTGNIIETSTADVCNNGDCIPVDDLNIICKRGE